ncbi:UDP-glycosyltransferase 76C2-like [Chenopodium quinoa]|uniref:UDP-glycosyltransferase 76C2-like n=1 Tax=Chenopodium quinoa TaxID=63459 RepID=UPI000B799DE7|nr:UDP-glycosyltransferase 76C2-like [Chenopodium quinoa]
MFHLATLLHVKGFAITIIQTKYRALDPTLFPHFTFHLLDDDGLPDNATFGPCNHTTILATLNTNCSEPFRNCISRILSKDHVACLITDPMWSFTKSVATSFGLPRIVLSRFCRVSLWVVRRGSIEGSNETDPLPLPEDYSDTICQRGNIVNWAPQQQFLAHPAVGGFLTHCGWNSIMESISEGVPMLCLPFFADQDINTRHVCDNWRIGMELDKGIQRGEIAKAVRKLMVEEDGQAMRSRVRALKEKATLSVIKGGSSYKSLENLTNYLMSF